MTTEPSRFVPKVHPASRPVEAEDPLSLHAISLEGDPELMLHCVVQEYAWMGCDGEEILRLFRDPSYPALHALWKHFGETFIRDRISQIVGRAPLFRVATKEQDEETAAGQPVLIDLGVPANWRTPGAPAQGNHHAASL